MYSPLKTAIYKSWCTAALLLVSGYLMAQQSVPIFANPVDSATYSRASAAIQEILKSSQDNDIQLNHEASRLDSLMLLLGRLRDNAIGTRVIFSAEKSFTPYEDLKNGKITADQVIKLSFGNSRMQVLPPEIFLCTNLQELELVNSSIKKLPARLNTLGQLRSIYIYNNVIHGRLKLGGNTVIREMVIRGVKASSLPKSYKNFRALDSLDLSRNIGISMFPDIYKNRKLRKLNLIENNLTLTDLKNKSNTSLEELNLQRNKIAIVPDAIGSFSKLKKLTFNYNEITDVRPGISRLQRLESISFYQNRLTEIPAGIFDLGNLRMIDLYYNRIQTVSPDIVKLKSLETLFLANNQITALPDNIGELAMLREMYLHNNKISSLPESVKELEGLKVLRINNNYFTSFPIMILGLKGLENLDISKNYIYKFPTELSKFTQLQILAVVNNPWENKEDVERVAEILRMRGTVVQTK